MRKVSSHEDGVSLAMAIRGDDYYATSCWKRGEEAIVVLVTLQLVNQQGNHHPDLLMQCGPSSCGSLTRTRMAVSLCSRGGSRTYARAEQSRVYERCSSKN